MKEYTEKTKYNTKEVTKQLADNYLPRYISEVDENSETYKFLVEFNRFIQTLSNSNLLPILHDEAIIRRELDVIFYDYFYAMGDSYFDNDIKYYYDNLVKVIDKFKEL